jgi:pyruvate/2-oxoglutarate/acetoin dehydrogenase E1 component
VLEARDRAWQAYRTPLDLDVRLGIERIRALGEPREELAAICDRLEGAAAPLRRDLAAGIREALILVRGEDSPARRELVAFDRELQTACRERYGSHLQGRAALAVTEEPPRFGPDTPEVLGFEVINACFDAIFERHPEVLAFGEDVGRIGDVNQGFRGLQEKYGELRISDTGIRECTILGQAIGLAMRGFRPIAEIQYLDYLLYALQLMSDDLATLRYRTAGGQRAPVIVRTRGHRLEGIWHSGSPMAGIIHLVRGVHVCVPRDLTRAAGFYNTLLAGDDPGLIVEVLNGYRLKERLPENPGEIRIPLGVPEVLREGQDVTLVTYGACCRVAQAACEQLAALGVEVELIDVQTLLPFDRHGAILASLQKTNRVVFLDEDVPGGTTATMLREVLEVQGGYEWLDAAPRTVTARPHRPAYGSDGDYWSKPGREQVFEAVWGMMHETDPAAYPLFYR